MHDPLSLSYIDLRSELSGRVHLVGVEGKPGSLLNLVEVHLEKKIDFNRFLFTAKIVLSTLINEKET